VRFLLDNNLSPRLVAELAVAHPGTAHVREFGLQRADDAVIWNLARERGFVILSKDVDFHQRSLLHGAPPKVVWLRVGNRSTREIAAVLRNRERELAQFEADDTASFLALS